MGQSGSKPPGSLPFGHVAFLDTSSPATDIQQSTNDDDQQNSNSNNEDEKHKDRLLSVPHQYGLTTHYSNSSSNSNLNSSTSIHYRPCTPPTPPTPLSFNFSSSPSSSSSSFSLVTLSHITDHMDTFNNNNKNNNNDEISPSHWITLINDVTYVDTTYYRKPSPPSNSNYHHTDTNDENESPLPPLPAFTMTEKPLTTTDLKSIDKTMHVISLTQQNLIRLNPNIGLFTMICKLDLANNKLSSLPETIGYLDRLETLYLGNNQLETLPDTIGHLTKLIELDVSHNQLNTLTPCIAYLKKLQVLAASHNLIHELPVHLAIGLKGLTILDLSHNVISVLPAEITQLHFLRRLLLDGCPLVDPSATATTATASSSSLAATYSAGRTSRTQKPPCYSQLHSPPSLLEQCARTIVRDTRHHSYYQQRFTQLPYHLVSYLYSAIPCTLCQGPYFDTYVTRGRLVERTGRWIPVEYRLCRAHFTNENDRLLCMFSSEGATFASTTMDSKSSSLSWNQPYRPPLPPTLAKKKKKKTDRRRKSASGTLSSLTTPSTSSSSSIYQDVAFQQHQTAASLMMESVIQQPQQEPMPQDENMRMDPINSNGWRAHRMKVMNKNQSGFLSLTKSSPLPGGGGVGGGGAAAADQTGDTIPSHHQQV
ncbi:hypothetical protein BCR42DRAFT_415937 [Absidia repens]|uniref:L domain-like protein n=1 Tax=Absidia repens TaxID=90262 RepID=A0A1X2IFY3_9FUNG|nr:hypothetical protein BCR42DRAFT_415937 [Absidia repens]